MGADIAADEHIHDVVTNAQFPFVQPDLDVENTVQLINVINLKAEDIYS